MTSTHSVILLNCFGKAPSRGYDSMTYHVQPKALCAVRQPLCRTRRGHMSGALCRRSSDTTTSRGRAHKKYLRFRMSCYQRPPGYAWHIIDADRLASRRITTTGHQIRACGVGVRLPVFRPIHGPESGPPKTAASLHLEKHLPQDGE
jgi:hypothetical protein